MIQDCLILYRPNVKIPFLSVLTDISGYLDEYGFKLTTFEDRPPIYHGKAWISEIDQVVIHFYFTNQSNQLESIMVHGGKESYNESIVDSYNRKQKWLEENYGCAHISKQNLDYGIFDYEWELMNCNIKHFILNRFGDEEGIYFRCK